jgi:hypothetical protein
MWARRPPWRRRMRCAILRLTLGRVARWSAFQAGSCWRVRAVVRRVSWWPMVVLRPVLESVHCARSGQVVQAAPKSALPAWRRLSLTRRIGLTVPLGQVTRCWSRLMSKRSLVNFPVGCDGWLDLGLGVDPGAVEPVEDLPGAVGGIAVDRGSAVTPYIAADAEVSYAVPWGDDTTTLGKLINSQSNKVLDEMYARAMGWL